MPGAAATDPGLAAALETLLRAPFGEVLALLGQSAAGPLIAPLLAEACASAVRGELDRREQYGAAAELLTGTPPTEEAEAEITAVDAAKLLHLGSSNTLLTQMRREMQAGVSELAACLVPGKEHGKGRRFYRSKIKALDARRNG